MPNMWTLDEGLKLVRAIQEPSRKFGYHITLGGSVLNGGESKKDIDLYFHPMDNGEPINTDGLLDWLSGLWGGSAPIGKDYNDDLLDGLFNVPHAPWEPIPDPAQPPVRGDWAAQQNAPIRVGMVWGRPEIEAIRQNAPAVGLRADLIQARHELERAAQRENEVAVENVLFRNVPMAFDNPEIRIKTSKAVYKFKLKFIRPGGDRIDVFII